MKSKIYSSRLRYTMHMVFWHEMVALLDARSNQVVENGKTG